MMDKSTSGVNLIAEERKRQILEEGWSAEHDDEHTDGSLALAAVCYATPVKLFRMDELANAFHLSDPWPRSWDSVWDKRYRYGAGRALRANYIPDPKTYSDEERIDLLVKAGALIAAEIDRLLR